MSRPAIVALIIFDGWGNRTERKDNAILCAHTPVMDRLYATQAHTEIATSGEAVGLAPGVMGNSEVGHTTIGSGRIIYQDVMRITKAIETGAFAKNPIILNTINAALQKQSTLHLWGLLSDGSVHSHIDHLLALLDLAVQQGLRKIAVHAILDGRDKPPRSALPFIAKVEAKLRQLGCGRIVTVSGRYYAMDRDQRWDRVERAWRAMVLGEAGHAVTARAAVEASYAAGKGDEFIEPCIIGDPTPISEGDQVLCYNFRADRARELTAALARAEFNDFPRPRFPQIGYACMTEYDASFGLPVAFGSEDIPNTLAAVLAQAGIKNFRVAETEKYAHVTYFMNGGIEAPYPGEERVLIPSSKAVATYDLEPEMQASKIAAKAAEAILARKFGVIVMNFANPDMVGHTGKMQPAVTAIETVDAALGTVIDALEKVGGVALITADHGNAEMMVDPETGEPHTAHTINPVPLILFDPAFKGSLKSGGGLADIAPTLLGMLGLPQPKEMTGHDLHNPKPR